MDNGTQCTQKEKGDESGGRPQATGRLLREVVTVQVKEGIQAPAPPRSRFAAFQRPPPRKTGEHSDAEHSCSDILAIRKRMYGGA